jgi:hypothetical protein
VTERELERIGPVCEATLRRNWREVTRQTDGAPFAYTRSSPGHFEPTVTWAALSPLALPVLPQRIGKFAWSSLIVEIPDPDPRAARGYLER